MRGDAQRAYIELVMLSEGTAFTNAVPETKHEAATSHIPTKLLPVLLIHRKHMQFLKVSCNQRFFLLATPPLNLLLMQDGIVDILKRFLVYKFHWSS